MDGAITFIPEARMANEKIQAALVGDCLELFYVHSIFQRKRVLASLVGPITAQAGAKASGDIQVPAAKDEATTIPITVIQGAKSGPVLALIAGNHGYEYTPILALQRLRERLDPQQLSGTVILVHVANMPSFLRRTIYYSPVDGKNLNRVYPGKPDGTVSERIAYQITKEVIERADYLLDLHCGDGNESLRPYSYWDVNGGGAAIVEKAKQMALAFGLDHIVMGQGAAYGRSQFALLLDTRDHARQTGDHN
jgi:predicted deacylase